MARIRNASLAPVNVSDKTIWRHVLLGCDDGKIGVGEFTLNDPHIDALVLELAKTFAGREVSACQSENDNIIDIPLLEATARSGLDQALCDLLAQEHQVPLARHLQADAHLSPVPLYANINRRTTNRTPEGFLASANDAIAAGYGAIKIAPFDGVDPSSCETGDGEDLIQLGLDRIRAVAGATIGVADLQVDCHWRFTTGRAVKLIAELSAIGVVWFECPIPEVPSAVPDLRRLRARCDTMGMRLAGCEMMVGRNGFAPYIEGDAYDVIMPDVKHAGGINTILKIADTAAAQGISTSMHNPSGPVAHIFSVHVTAASRTSERLEIQFDESLLFNEIVTPSPIVQAGQAYCPSGAGVGISFSVAL